MQSFFALSLGLSALVYAGSAPVAVPDAETHQSETRSPDLGRCDPARVRHARTTGTAKARTLNQLPPGNLDLAVMRHVNGCLEPVTIRENYGAFGSPRPATDPPPPSAPALHLLGR